DLNDLRIKIKESIITDKKTRNIVKVCKCSYDNLTDFCIWCNEEYCSKRTLAHYNDNSGLFDYSLDKEIKKLLNLLDKFEYNVQIKESHINYSPFIQCFTSNIPLEELYKYAKTETRIKTNDSWIPNRKYYNALERYFDYIIEYQRVNNEREPCIGE
ncbi:18155_t:CDS:2, partial [Racocetra persica]